MEIEKKLKETFFEVFEKQEDSITLQTKQNDFEGWDSLGQLRIIMAIEENFNISFSIDEIANLNTFEKILNCVNQKLSVG